MSKELRVVYQEVLSDLMKKDKNVVMLDADLASASGSLKTFESFPNQTVNCGISEANMISAACGMSLVGLKPYVHTFAPFATRRVFDQLYMSGAFSQNAIHIFGSEPGIYAQYNGGTHTSFEDIALTRTLPNAVITSICDAHQFEFVLRSFYKDNKLYYTRSGRKALPDLYTNGTRFELGKWMKHGDALDQVIISHGWMVHECLEACKELKDVTVIDAFSIYPYDNELLMKLSHTSKIMVVEDHNIVGGVGELVARELMIHGYKGEFIHLGIEQQVSEVGDFEFLKQRFGLTKENIISLWNK